VFCVLLPSQLSPLVVACLLKHHFYCPHHHRQRLFIRHPVLKADFDQLFRGQAAVPDQFLRIGKRHGLVGSGMKDSGVRLHGIGRAPGLPCRAQQNQRRIPSVDVHSHCTTSGTADHDIGLTPVVLGLSDTNGGVEVVVGQGGIDDVVAVVLEAGRLQGAWSRVPAVEEEDVHGVLSIRSLVPSSYHPPFGIGKISRS